MRLACHVAAQAFGVNLSWTLVRLTVLNYIRWFGLGMAPLSGLSTHRLASRWSRLGALIQQRGDWFYQFEGLRAFKEKFKPEWRPRYLAYPGGFALPQVLLDITVLIAKNPQRTALDAELPVLVEAQVAPAAHHAGP